MAGQVGVAPRARDAPEEGDVWGRCTPDKQHEGNDRPDEHAFQHSRHRVEIYGVCRDCLRRELVVPAVGA